MRRYKGGGKEESDTGLYRAFRASYINADRRRRLIRFNPGVPCDSQMQDHAILMVGA
ncbi:hypothetical protein DSM19430T_17600 [Desulfovibrio psychrotolerans]|uniref:Uncharacterized protein n=1 Tax=Desulfovibrio psychrotolerans TaxID=415242 RepID=A0A7J0BTM6_9BACT|nr:hypothetical protein DSM19430T_17600 [Desulfovibrio psychrotolerans]